MADESIHPPPGGAPSSSATASEGPVPRSQKSATEPKKDMPSSSPSFSDPARTGSRESRERKKKVAPPPKGSAQKGKVEDGTVHNSSSVENEKTQQTRSPKPNPKKNSHNRGRKGAPVDETKEVKETTVDTESQSPNSRKPRSQKRSASPSQNKKKPQRKEKKHKLVLVKFSPKMMYSGLPLVTKMLATNPVKDLLLIAEGNSVSSLVKIVEALQKQKLVEVKMIQTGLSHNKFSSHHHGGSSEEPKLEIIVGRSADYEKIVQEKAELLTEEEKISNTITAGMMRMQLKLHQDILKAREKNV